MSNGIEVAAIREKLMSMDTLKLTTCQSKKSENFERSPFIRMPGFTV